MAALSDDSNGGFCFIWTIKNFYHLRQNCDSPSFVLNTLKDIKWKLRLELNGAINSKITFSLKCLSSPDRIVNFILSIRKANRQFLKTKNELFRKELSDFLDNDELTLRCRMWVDSSELLNSVRCYATTKMIAVNVSYMCKLTSFWENERQYICNHHSAEIQTYSSKIVNLQIQILTSEGFGENCILSLISMETYKPIFLTCKMSLLDADERVVYSVKGEQWSVDRQSRKCFIFDVISQKQLYEQRELYLPRGLLSLHLEMDISIGDTSSEEVRFEYGTVGNNQLKSLYKIKDVNSPPRAWADNFQRFYSEGKFSDLIIQTPSKEFRVHKTILCAQSAVFSAMFESNLKEKQTGIVEIEDLEDDTIHYMLLFIYTGISKDLDWEMAFKLYYAADKYEIMELKNVCSTFLKDTLDVSKVCNVLVLADKHQDDDLKSTAQNFIVDNVEVINLEVWKKLMRENSLLTSEIMHLMILRNFKSKFLFGAIA